VTDALPPAALVHRPAIVRSAQFYYGIPAPVPVIAAQIMQESQFNPSAQSGAGAQGLMQFMPSTAKWAGPASGAGAAQPFNAAWAIRAGVWYDRYLYDRVPYAADCDKWGAALSAYNGGLGWHAKRQARAQDPSDFWNEVRFINPGITPANQRENQSYPERIVLRWQPLFATWGRTVCLDKPK
jgi:soluble lytic murein transglycosylase-like protein